MRIKYWIMIFLFNVLFWPNIYAQDNLNLSRTFFLEINSSDYKPEMIPSGKVWEIKNFVFSVDENDPNKDRNNNVAMLQIRHNGIEYKGISSSMYYPIFLPSNTTVSFKILPYKDYDCKGLLTIFEYEIK